MDNDLGASQRRQWLGALARRHLGPLLRQAVEALAGRVLPARRRTRTLLRTTLIRL
jgi:hypothetical protein